jgi:hypothetical protein
MRFESEKNERQHVKAVTFKLDGAKCGVSCAQPEQLLRSFSDRIYRMSKVFCANSFRVMFGFSRRISMILSLVDFFWAVFWVVLKNVESVLSSNIVKPQSIYLIEMWINGENLMISRKSYGRYYQIGKWYCDPCAPERCRYFAGSYPNIPCYFQISQLCQALFNKIRFFWNFHAL